MLTDFRYKMLQSGVFVTNVSISTVAVEMRGTETTNDAIIDMI